MDFIQRSTSDKFEFYRRGQPWDQATRLQFLFQRAVPNPNPDDTNDLARAAALQQARDARVASGAQRYPNRPGGLAAYRPVTDLERRQNIRELIQLMWDHKDNLKFSRTLGWGGMSLATLWLWRDPATGRQRPAVLKNALGDGPKRHSNRIALNNERHRLKLLARAKHIVQRFRVAELIGGPAAGNIDEKGGVWLEWARKGDLDGLLSAVAEAVRAAQAGERRFTRNWDGDADFFPTLVVWQIFDCLAKACIAMTFPPRLQAFPAQDSAWRENGNPLREVVPPFPLAPYNVQADIIHFDLDPSNVFISGTDNDHQDVSVFQVADLGLAETVRATRRSGVTGPLAPNQLPFHHSVKGFIWGVRNQGKYGYYLPEQFTPDWDRVNLLSDPFSDGMTGLDQNPNDVAANYGPWSNIYQVGQIMWCCITLLRPNRAPIPQPMPTAPGPVATRPRTYGADVLDQVYTDRYGQELCELVARCMMHRPADRPTLNELQAQLDAIRPVGPVAPLTRAWVRKYFRDAPAARAKLVDFDFRPQFDPATGVRNRLYWRNPRDANDNPTRLFTPFR